jgi:hypothetical protein
LWRRAMKCPKCNDEMEEGLQLDASYGGVRKTEV